MSMHQFPQKLRTLRERHGMTQRDLAKALGLTQGYIYFLENGQRRPNVDLLIKLANLFNVTLDQLARDEVELDDGRG